MREIIFNLLSCLLYGVIVLAVQTVVRVVVPYVKTKLASTQYAWAADIIEHAVRAHEQMIQGTGQGEERFRMVIAQVTEEFNKIGISFTKEQISTLIEAAVQTMNTEKALADEMNLCSRSESEVTQHPPPDSVTLYSGEEMIAKSPWGLCRPCDTEDDLK